MKYLPKKMIRKSRFSVLYDNSDDSAKRFVTERISRYIAENPEYCDNKNYGHLCNLFSALAYEEYFEQNYLRAEAVLLCNEKPRQCRGYQKAMPMSRKKEPPMI